MFWYIPNFLGALLLYYNTMRPFLEYKKNLLLFFRHLSGSCKKWKFFLSYLLIIVPIPLMYLCKFPKQRLTGLEKILRWWGTHLHFFLPISEYSFFSHLNKRFFILTFPDFKIKTQKPVRYIHFLHISKSIVPLSIKSQGLCKIKNKYLLPSFNLNWVESWDIIIPHFSNHPIRESKIRV